jgi:inorganic pyrophosphatase
MNAWHDVSPGEGIPEKFTVYIEVPAESRNKYEMDKETGLIKLDRVLYSPVHYPGDYGFIPQTYWEDGDPVDVLVLSHHPVVPGCLMDVRPIGVLKMNDSGEEDDKVICVPLEDPKFNETISMKDVSQHKQKEIIHFFEIYKQLQKKEVKVRGIEDKKEAINVVKKGLQLYKDTILKK